MPLADFLEETLNVFNHPAVINDDYVDQSQEMGSRDLDVAEYPIHDLSDGDTQSLSERCFVSDYVAGSNHRTLPCVRDPHTASLVSKSRGT